jgi:hypothetical protein
MTRNLSMGDLHCPMSTMRSMLEPIRLSSVFDSTGEFKALFERYCMVTSRGLGGLFYGKTTGQNSRETVPSELWICGPRITSQSPFGSARHLEEDSILSPTDSNITSGERNTEVILLYYC